MAHFAQKKSFCVTPKWVWKTKTSIFFSWMFVSLGFFWNYRRKMFKVRIYISKSLSNRWNAEKAISRESEHTVRISQKSDKILDFIAFFKVSFKAYFFQHKVPLESRFYFMHDHWIGQYNFCSFDPYCIKKIYNELKILQWKSFLKH